MSKTTISLQNISKKFSLNRGGSSSVKAAVLDLIRGTKAPEADILWALKDVSFSVQEGETLGIIGANGAGKSTLLSIITGTMQASGGTITTDGRISALLELGAGFHPDMSGRENVYLFGAIMGLSRAQIDKRFDAIVEFAGLNRFIDQPVKHYSSGMYVRLGFAVAVEVEPEILLVDEVLAVGDIDFQRKCIQRMEEYRSSGKTMLIISHDMHTISKVSDRIILLDHGRILGDGPPSEIVKEYEELIHDRQMKSMQREWGTLEARITSVDIRNAAGEKSTSFTSDDALIATLHYTSDTRIEDPVFGFALSDKDGRIISGNNSQIEGLKVGSIEGEGCVTMTLPSLPVSTATYLLSFSLHSGDHKINYHRLDNLAPIEVDSVVGYDGFYLPSVWKAGS